MWSVPNSKKIFKYGQNNRSYPPGRGTTCEKIICLKKKQDYIDYMGTIEYKAFYCDTPMTPRSRGEINK